MIPPPSFPAIPAPPSPAAPPPSPPPPQVDIVVVNNETTTTDLNVMLLNVRSAAAVGVPVVVTVSTGQIAMEDFTFDARTTASEVVLVGLPGSELVAPGVYASPPSAPPPPLEPPVRDGSNATARRARSLQTSGATPAASSTSFADRTMLFTLEAGGPTVCLAALDTREGPPWPWVPLDRSLVAPWSPLVAP